MKKRIFTAFTALALVLGLMAPAEAALDASTTYKAVSTDCCTTLAVTSGGELWAWGDNTYGQVGAGDLEDSDYPRYIMGGVAQVLSAGNSSYAITEKGVLYSWGLNESGQLGYWGGDGKVNDYNCRWSPQQVMSGVTSVTAEGGAVFAITTSGVLYGWGGNNGGRLGTGSAASTVSSPVKIMEKVKKVVTSGESAYAITTSGDLYGWGSNTCGQLGLGDTAARTSPTLILSGVSDIALTDSGVIAMMADGALYSWGLNDRGQLGYSGGNGQVENSVTGAKRTIQTVPQAVGLNDAAAIAAYGTAAYAVTTGGVLYGWGGNAYGQLGQGNTTDSAAPVKIMENVSGIYAVNTVYAITAGGELYAWGSNIYGQTGTGSGDNVVTSPKRVLTGVKSVSASWTSLSAFAILKTGGLYGWGGNHLGQLGFQSEEGSGYIEATPIQIVEHERKSEETPVRVSTPSSWAADEVSAALKMGIVPDDIQGYYQAYILRVEFAELVVKTIERVTGKTMPTGAAFDDCTDTSVLKARAAGIVSGKDGNNFDPWNEITREEMAKMIINTVRYLEDFSNREYIKEYTGGDTGLFTGVSAWAMPYMKLAYANGYIKGDGASLAPLSSTSCEQAILIVYRAVKGM